MMTEKMTYRWLWSCLIAGGLLLLSGCSGSSEDDQQQFDILQLRAVTRTEGAFKIPNEETPASNIRLFLATLSPTNEDPNHYSMVEGTCSYSDQWSSSSSLKVKEETPYYLYGYMPSSISASQSAPEGNDYSKGINLTLSNLPAITSDDICVLVGVQRVETKSTEPTELPTITEGQYGFRTGIKGKNYLNLLMAHLYTKVKVSFKIDSDYAELRSIHLKKVTLTSKYADGESVTLNLRSGQGIGSPTFPSGSETEEHTVTLLNTSDAEKVLDKALADSEDPALTLDLPAYCRPVAGDTYNLTLTTTYDVYDTKGSKLGEQTSENEIKTERTSVNKIQLNMADVRPGKEKVLVLTVMPTYLYVLSDNDADNPTIKVE